MGWWQRVRGRLDGVLGLTARLRVRAADAVVRLLLGELVGGLPATSIRSLEEHAATSEVAAHLERITPWRSAAVVDYPLPDTLGPAFRRTGTFEVRRILDLTDVVVAPASGLAWVPGGPVLEEGIGSLRRMIGWDDARPDLLRRPVGRISGRPVVSLAGGPFFHFLTEELTAAVAGLRHDEEATLLVPAQAPRYLADAIGWFRDLDLLRHDPVTAHGPVRVDHLVLPARSSTAGFVHPDDLSDLRATLGRDVVGVPATRMVYVSRRQAAARALPGEADLERHLVAAGLESVVMEELDLVAQVRTMAAARVVVAPHGAGLAHLTWCAAGGRLVEVFPPGYVNDCFARLAVAVGMDYVAVHARPDGTVDHEAVMEAVSA